MVKAFFGFVQTSDVEKYCEYWNILKATKKVCIVPQKWKGTKNSFGDYPTEFAGSTQNKKKMFETPNQSIRTKIFPI
jgi:hypothetical protein